MEKDQNLEIGQYLLEHNIMVDDLCKSIDMRHHSRHMSHNLLDLGECGRV